MYTQKTVVRVVSIVSQEVRMGMAGEGSGWSAVLPAGFCPSSFEMSRSLMVLA